MAVKIAVIGAGPGGYVAAIRAAQAGAEVTVVEKDTPGGVCLNRGCIPSKIFQDAASLLLRIRKSDQFGITVGHDIRVDPAALQLRKQKVIEPQVAGIEKLFSRHSIRLLKGEGIIRGPGKAVVRRNGNSQTEIAWEKLIIATGSSPLALPGTPFDGRIVVTSDEILNLAEFPKKVIIIGGGAIGCEFASILNAFGAKVTIVEGLTRLLPIPAVDWECSRTLEREMKKQKIDVMLGRTVNNIEILGDKARLAVVHAPYTKVGGGKKSQSLMIEANMVLVSIGRGPNTQGLGTENLGLAVDKQGWIQVDNTMQTSHPDIFAIGDAVGPERIMLAHVATAEAMVAAANAMGANKTMDYCAIPSAIYTMPEVACVGFTEKGAQDEGYEVKTGQALFRTIGKSQIIGEIGGMVKIVSEKSNGRILGVHIIGPHATDLIAEATLAVKNKTTVKELMETIHAHPTLSEVIMEAAFNVAGNPLHGL